MKRIFFFTPPTYLDVVCNLQLAVGSWQLAAGSWQLADCRLMDRLSFAAASASAAKAHAGSESACFDGRKTAPQVQA